LLVSVSVSRKVREQESAKVVSSGFSLRMRRQLFFLIIAIAFSHAQVPKPPWASGGSGSTKPASSNTSKNSDISDSASAGQNPEATLKVDVKLVNVFVTVTDDHGAPVAGLKKENFTLLEDG